MKTICYIVKIIKSDGSVLDTNFDRLVDAERAFEEIPDEEKGYLIHYHKDNEDLNWHTLKHKTAFQRCPTCGNIIKL